MFLFKNLLIKTFVMFLVFFTLTSLSFGADDETGVIKGKVNYCGKGGYLGMQVFIPGRQFMVLLGVDGKFIFNDVPVGSYDINYAINGKLVNENKNISVSAGGTSDLGEIVFCDEAGVSADESTTEAKKDDCEENPEAAGCVDADKDGVIAIKDCNDNDPSIRPGAIEQCDGVDNNCNGQIDENSFVAIPNGQGNCDAGKISVKSCNKGFDDCDKNPVNGCETDIFNDNENCGACGNECSALDICKLGIC